MSESDPRTLALTHGWFTAGGDRPRGRRGPAAGADHAACPLRLAAQRLRRFPLRNRCVGRPAVPLYLAPLPHLRMLPAVAFRLPTRVVW